MIDRLPDGWITLVCPPGAESAPISHGATAYRSYRVHKASDVWLVDVPLEVARPLMRNGGFYVYQAEPSQAMISTFRG
jgi:hypothetical protein